MASRKLARNVTTPDEDGRMVTFAAGTTVSAKVAEGITNPKAFEEEEVVTSEPEDVATPKTAAKKAAAKKS